MPDYRSRRLDPLAWTAVYEPAARRSNAGGAWIAGALVLILLSALAFGVGRGPNRFALSNAALSSTRLSSPPPFAAAPRPLNPAYPGLTPPAQGNAQRP